MDLSKLEEAKKLQKEIENLTGLLDPNHKIIGISFMPTSRVPGVIYSSWQNYIPEDLIDKIKPLLKEKLEEDIKKLADL